MSEIFSITVLGLAAILAVIGVVLSIALVLHWGHKREEGLMPYIFYPTFFILGLTTLLSGRDLYLTTGIYGIEYVDHFIIKPPLLIWAGRANSLFILFASSERIVRRFLSSGRKPEAPVLLIVALWTYYLTNIVSSAFLGAHTSISHEYFYSIAAGSGALLLSQHEGNVVVCNARNALCIFIALSAMMLIFRPEMVISASYKGFIPGFNLRYFGLTNHPNVFGPLIVVFLICLWSKPFSTSWLNILSWVIGLVSLVLTQSKTSWIIIFVCAICLGYFRYGDYFRQRIFDFRHAQLSAVLLLTMFLLSTAIIGFMVIFASPGEAIYSFFATSEGNRILNLSGREQIWEASIREWGRNPLFGYGLSIWDERYQARIGIPAFHAHNQYYQSLSSSGIVGVTGLVFYTIILFGYVVKTAKSSGGLTMALFMILLVRSYSEVPLSMESLGPDIIPHVLLLMVIAPYWSKQRTETFGVKIKASVNNCLASQREFS